MGIASASFSAFSLLFLLPLLNLQGIYGDNGGWQGGHATFYGGGDASGTMGMFIVITLSAITKLGSFSYGYCVSNEMSQKV